MPVEFWMQGSATAIAAVAVFALAGAVKGLIGLGLPTLSMALLALWMPPAQAAALLIVPSLVTNVWQAGPWRTLWPLLRRLRAMLAGAVVGTLATAWTVGALAGRAGTLLLGLALLAYAAWGLSGRRWRVPAAHEGWLGAVVGALTGVVTAFTGVFVIPAVPWMQSLGLEKDELVQAMGIAFTLSTLALAAGLGLSAHANLMLDSLWMLPPALAGMAIGQRLRARLPVAVFRRCFFLALGAMGAWMLLRALP